jgi:hypothetical protein
VTPLLLQLALAGSAYAGCADPFAEPDDILTFTLSMDSVTWNDLTFEGQEGSGCEAQWPYHEVDFRCGDEAPIQIGARRKRGDQRGRDTDFKPPLKLDINQYVVGQRWPAEQGDFGFKRLSLNNGQEDNPGGVLTALLTEHLAWRLMARELPEASGVAYVRLYVELTDLGETNYHGLYILVEDIDRTALKRRYGPDIGNGALLKTTTGSCRDQVVFDDLPYTNQATDSFEAWMDLSPPEDTSWVATSDEHIYLDALLRQEALRDVLANGADTVLGQNYSNYFSYDDAGDSRRRYLPWDLDDVFRPYPQNVPYTTNMEGSCSEIGRHTRCEDFVEEEYNRIACQLINGTLQTDRLIAEFDAVDALIRPIIADETDYVWGGVDPLEIGPNNNYQAEYTRIRQWIADRIPEIRDQLADRGYECPDACTPGEVEACDYLHCDGERSCVDGLWTGCELISTEILDNGIDDDCDNEVDEGAPTGTQDTDTTSDTDGDPVVSSPESESGCGCDTGSSGSPWWLALILALIRSRSRWMNADPSSSSRSALDRSTGSQRHGCRWPTRPRE